MKDIEINYQGSFLYDQTLCLEITGEYWSKDLWLTLDKDTKAHRLIYTYRWGKTIGEMNINNLDTIFKQIYLAIKREGIFYDFCFLKANTTNQEWISHYYSLVKQELRDILYYQSKYIESFLSNNNLIDIA